jgi:hypothetical protein
VVFPLAFKNLALDETIHAAEAHKLCDIDSSAIRKPTPFEVSEVGVVDTFNHDAFKALYASK